MNQENQYLSVKEFSAKVGKTPQAIYQQLDRRLKRFTKQLNGKTVIDIRAVEIFYQSSVDESEQLKLDYIKQVEQVRNESQQMFEILNKRLEEQDTVIKEQLKQIDRLQTQLERNQELLNQQQQLMLITTTEGRRHWWQFGRKKQTDGNE